MFTLASFPTAAPATLTPSPASNSCCRHQPQFQTVKVSPKLNKLRSFASTSVSKSAGSICTPAPEEDSITAKSTLKNQLKNPLMLSEEITQLCESKSSSEVFRTFQENLEKAFYHSSEKSEALGVLLQACGKQKDIQTGRKVHEMVTSLTQLKDDVILCTRLISMYSMCGYPSDSLSVFHQLRSKKLYQWNVLMSGYTKNELWVDAICLFIELMTSTEERPDNFTFPLVIKACGGVLDVGLGEAIHGMASKMGLVSDVFVSNALISMYGKFSLVEEAMKVFEHMPERNLVSSNSMISGFSANGYIEQSFDLFRNIFTGDEVLVPDTTTVVIMLPICAGAEEVEFGKIIHGLAVKLGLADELTVNNSLVDMYCKVGYFSDAQILFEKNESKNVVSWNSIIGGYSGGGDDRGTFHLMRRMQSTNEYVKANEVTLLNVLPVCQEESEQLIVKELHGYSLRNGLEYHELLTNAFIAAYAKCEFLRYAELVFYGVANKTVSSWNALISGYAQNEDPSKALALSSEMMDSGLLPDWFTIGSLLFACSHLKLLHCGTLIHGFVLRNGLETDMSTLVSLVSFYMTCGKYELAQRLFDRIEDKNVVSWNVMIAGYLQNALPDKAFCLLRDMVSHRFQPDEISVTSVLGACSKLPAVRLGKEVHCFALKSNLIEDSFVHCSIIDMYAKSGFIEMSKYVFGHIPLKDIASWTAMITGYAVHGLGMEAIELFQEMQKSGFSPASLTYVSILMACNHAGLIEEGRQYVKEMQTLHGLKPELEHYACVIDMLARAGQFDDALNLMAEMPMQPDTQIWCSLLNSCIVHAQSNLGKKCANKLLELEPKRAEIYVLVSNFFARYGDWDSVRQVRDKMKELGLQKEIGCSQIEIGGKSYNFAVCNMFSKP
ncbi:pentatricopeptide repeat-containing protein At1g18485-like [Solanum verrucosum]|uniref:pentatricopeptide repeat-containing protein At1g18485-like n=1 Tax=Solanum verrucosum TaxID=315347 RepID=UPI0020D01ED0|nr:pentatricopeptide repeat-containing protein At1g18485-like [Solanum verrucosum]